MLSRDFVGRALVLFVFSLAGGRATIVQNTTRQRAKNVQDLESDWITVCV
jgi:hypothetical protein